MSLSSNKTKENLIELIAAELIKCANKHSFDNKLVVTSKSPFPKQSHRGITIIRHDMETTFDEADYIIPHQVVIATLEGRKIIKVISADTDVFLLLCHTYQSASLNADVFLEDFVSDKNTVSIRKTVEKHAFIIPSILSAHALTGCDTVPMMCGIGKAKTINIMQKLPLVHMGDLDAKEDDVIQEGKLFVAQCYGMKNVSSSENRLA